MLFSDLLFYDVLHFPENILTACRPDGLFIKYPQFMDVLNALNIQPHNIFLLTV
jgi:hypothetical protein